MSDEAPSTKKDELLLLVSSAEESAAQLVAANQKVVESAQLARDTASCVKDFVTSLPDNLCVAPQWWDQQIDAWRTWRGTASGLSDALGSANSLSLATGSVVVTTSGTMLQAQFLNPSPDSSVQRAHVAVVRFSAVLQREPLVERAQTELQRLDLNRPQLGQRSPSAVLREALEVLGRPSGSAGAPAAVLLSVREAIQGTLGGLIRRRPTQEPAKKTGEKVASIGRQCGRCSLPPDFFKRMGAQAEALIDALSSAKQSEMPREVVSALFNRGVLFLATFLEALDETKLRP
ncbi:MAG: hypothetical protein ACHQ9S_00060 [Candidatus Binatia bacterium]